MRCHIVFIDVAFNLAKQHLADPKGFFVKDREVDVHVMLQEEVFDCRCSDPQRLLLWITVDAA